jgi:hypothetical protein
MSDGGSVPAAPARRQPPQPVSAGEAEDAEQQQRRGAGLPVDAEAGMHQDDDGGQAAQGTETLPEPAGDLCSVAEHRMHAGLLSIFTVEIELVGQEDKEGRLSWMSRLGSFLDVFIEKFSIKICFDSLFSR